MISAMRENKNGSRGRRGPPRPPTGISARTRPSARPAFLGLSLRCAPSRTRVLPGVHHQPLARQCSFAANLTPSGPQLQLSFLPPLLSHDFLPALAGVRSGPRGILRAPAPAAAVPVAHVGVLRAGRGRPSALREAGGGQGARGRRWRGAGEEAGSPGGKGAETALGKGAAHGFA